MVQRFSSVVLAAIASVLALLVVFHVPTAALLRFAHLLPARLEPRLAVGVAQSVTLVLLFAGLKAGPRSVSPCRPTLGGLQAVGWMTLAGSLFSLLVALTLAAGESKLTATSLAAPLVERWTVDFPRSGMLGKLAVMVILAPMIEEFFFRGLVIGRLMRDAPAWVALAVSSVLFALGHDSGVHSTLFALGVGLLYLRYRNVWLCVLAHGAHNLLASIGASLLAAHLADHGLTMNLGYWTLPVQLLWFATVLACAAMFLRRVFGRMGNAPILRLRQPVGSICGAPP